MAWRTAESLLQLRKQINSTAPRRSIKSDGTIGDKDHTSRSSDHNPWVQDGTSGVVTAMDVTHDPAGGCNAGVLAEALRSSRDPRVKYIIWNRRLANFRSLNGVAAWQWRPYTGTNPHTAHVHISVRSVKALYDVDSEWKI